MLEAWSRVSHFLVRQGCATWYERAVDLAVGVFISFAVGSAAITTLIGTWSCGEREGNIYTNSVLTYGPFTIWTGIGVVTIVLLIRRRGFLGIGLVGGALFASVVFLWTVLGLGLYCQPEVFSAA